MSSKLLCACGNEHGTEEPLVITITACPNKKRNHSHKSSAPSSSKKPYAFVECPATRNQDDHSQRTTDRATGNESAEPSKHILICEDEGVTIPLRTAEKPLIDNSAFCDLDNERDKSSRGTVTKETNEEQPQRGTNERSQRETNKDQPQRGTNKDQPQSGTNKDQSQSGTNKDQPQSGTNKDQPQSGTDKDQPQSGTNKDQPQSGTNKDQPQRGTSTPNREKKKDKGPSSGNEEANDTFFDPSRVFNPADLNTSSRIVEPADSERSLLTDISSIIRWQNDDSHDKTSPRSGPSTVDKARKLSSDMQLKLPVLLPRYHGPGCAMEVDVMEKHDLNCSYRKKKNPDRNPIDDRSGSYEVIGRLMFKTCLPGNAIDTQNKTNQIRDRHNATVATIYSLLNIPHMFNKGRFLNTNEDEQKVEKYLARKKILEDLAKSSKSFPNQSKRQIEENRKINDIQNGSNTGHGKKMTSYEVEVLYFYKKKCNKSVQFSQMPSSRIGLKKWLYHIFPCVLVEDSQTLLINEF